MSDDQVQINFRADPALKAKIDQAAAAARLSAAEWCRRALAAAAEADSADLEERVASVEKRIELLAGNATIGASTTGAGAGWSTSGVGHPD